MTIEATSPPELTHPQADAIGDNIRATYKAQDRRAHERRQEVTDALASNIDEVFDRFAGDMTARLNKDHSQTQVLELFMQPHPSYGPQRVLVERTLGKDGADVTTLTFHRKYAYQNVMRVTREPGEDARMTRLSDDGFGHIKEATPRPDQDPDINFLSDLNVVETAELWSENLNKAVPSQFASSLAGRALRHFHIGNRY